MRSDFKTHIFAGILMCLSSVGATAATLVPGGSIFVTGTTVAADPALAGTVINDDILETTPVNIPADNHLFAVDFDVQNRVARSGLDGTLIFAPRILFNFNITFAPFLIDSIELTGFGDFATDVAYRTDGLGDRGPTFGDRSIDGETLTLDFGFPLVVSNLSTGIHEESYFLSINTDATAFENTGRATIFGHSILAPGEVFRFDYSGLAVPVLAPVPVPASAILLLSCLGIGFGFRRRQAR